MRYAAMFNVVVPIKTMSMDLVAVWAADVHRRAVPPHSVGLIFWHAYHKMSDTRFGHSKNKFKTECRRVVLTGNTRNKLK